MRTTATLAPMLALALAMPAPAGAQTSAEEVARLRTLALGVAAVAAVALAARAAERDREERAEDREARRLPVDCLRPVRGLEGATLLHGFDCLDAEVDRSSELPLSCAVTLRTVEGFATGFDPHCLAEEGWATQ